MSIPSTALASPPNAPQNVINFVDQNGVLTPSSMIMLQQLQQYVAGTARLIPCNCTFASNLYSLTLPTQSPVITQYSEFDTFAFIAPAASTGNVTANFTNGSGKAFATLNVYKAGPTQATSGDIAANDQYFLTWVDAFNSGAGGFRLR